MDITELGCCANEALFHFPCAVIKAGVVGTISTNIDTLLCDVDDDKTTEVNAIDSGIARAFRP